MILSEEQLQEKRTPEELDKFAKDIFNSIRLDETVKKQARMKKDIFKVLIEEFYPFSVFCIEKYNDQNVKCFPVVGNQGYDAIIETEDGGLKETVEFTWPIYGQKEHFECKQLNENGHTAVDVWDFHNNSKRLEIIEHIVNTAHKKALKDYNHPEGSSLVFVLNIAPHFGMHEVECKDDIKILTERLKKINFKVRSVYILLLPIRELIEVINS